MNETENDPILAALNPPQREAVTFGDGPLLILAGAGSGKTRVLAHRIAYLVERRNVPPSSIISLTFTNKAAGEMKERVAGLLGGSLHGAWLGTFHSIALRILRTHGELTKWGASFSVYDSDDQKRLAKDVAASLSLDTKKYKPASLLAGVSRAKDDGRGFSDFEVPGVSASPHAKVFYSFYKLYTLRLQNARALDFGDLLLETLRLFEERPEIARRYAEKFRHVLIDEYQDTNRVQYLLAGHLSSVWGNICAVGDDDQSIYGWRGADLRNILDFEKDFPGTKIIKLEQNYRSTAAILEAAASVISHNVGRHKKTLWTSRKGGVPVVCHTASTEEEEAQWIVEKIISLLKEGQKLKDIAILYRTHALSRPVEEALMDRELRYVVYGGLRFYERREIKDAMACLRLVAQPYDPVALKRVINEPPRGIGDKTVAAIFSESEARELDLFATMRLMVEEGVLPPRASRAVAGFIELVEGWRIAHAEGERLGDLLSRILRESGLRGALERAKEDEKEAERLENLEELLNAADVHAAEGGTVLSFLDRAALISDQESGKPGWDGMTLMTIHSAKGLEFPCVFIAGMEEEVFPHALSSSSKEEVEEERRLCYVAMTRAKDRLFLTRARVRRVFGAEGLFRPPSRFLFELPEKICPRDYPTARPCPEKRGFTVPPRIPPKSEAAPQKEYAPEAKTNGRSLSVDPENCDYKKGMKVRHPKYGDGVVTATDGRGPTARVSVDFRRGEKKKFVAGLSGLEILIDD
ncbi:ATP-dependent DNA helicase PcrA [bacterium]|nr:MAG: ATP-dependent DNA helicase PcrA [bacterium]